MTRFVRSAALTLVAATSLALTTPLASGASSTAVAVYNCSTLSVKPATIVLACADANQTLTHLKWTAWGTPRAHATGVLGWNTCTPTCAAGSWRTRKVNVTLSGLTKVAAHWLYTSAHLSPVTGTTVSATVSLPSSAL